MNKVYIIDNRRRPVDLPKRLAQWPRLVRAIGLQSFYGVADTVSAFDATR